MKAKSSILTNLPKPFLVLAPMDDVTDTVFRQVISDCAKPDLFFTEFVNVDGLQSPGRQKLLNKLKLSAKEGPVVAQLWGLNPENYYKTVQELVDGTLVSAANGHQAKGSHNFAGVDINMGCPVKNVIKNGACAALINNRQLAGKIIDAVNEAAGGKIPVSVKTRVGFDKVDMAWPEFLLSKKLNMLSIHGRTAKELSKVPANWDLIGDIRQMRDSIAPGTLILGNGDVNSRPQALTLAKKYRLDGIMVGRGIFHDPFLFAGSSPWPNMNKKQKLELFVRHIELYLKTYGENERKFEALRKFCKVYINGFDGASELRSAFMNTNNPQQALGLLSTSEVK